MKYYRVFNRRLISEPMLMDQLRLLAGTQTVSEMAAHAGLSEADRDPARLRGLFARYCVPYQPDAVPPVRMSVQQRVATASAYRVAQIELARAEAGRAPRFKPPGPLEW